MRVVQTGSLRGASWRVACDDGDLVLHFLLWLREASDVAVPGTGDTVPPSLLTTPDPIPVAIDARDWLAWWRALLQWQFSSDDWWGWWQRCPPSLAETVEPFRDRGLTWVQSKVKDSAARASRRSNLEFGDHIQAAVTQLQRERGSRLDALDVTIHGLAVKGDWVRVEPSGSPVLVSWSQLSRPQSWILDALRQAAARAATG